MASSTRLILGNGLLISVFVTVTFFLFSERLFQTEKLLAAQVRSNINMIEQGRLRDFVESFGPALKHVFVEVKSHGGHYSFGQKSFANVCKSLEVGVRKISLCQKNPLSWWLLAFFLFLILVLNMLLTRRKSSSKVIETNVVVTRPELGENVVSLEKPEVTDLRKRIRNVAKNVTNELTDINDDLKKL